MRLSNPIVFRELLQRLRSKNSFGYLFVFIVLSSLFFCLSWYSYTSSISRMIQLGGRVIFFNIASTQWFVLYLVVPLIAATVIRVEYNRNTWEMLRSSPLSLWSVVIGKLIAIVVFMWLMMVSALPLYSLLFFAGGVGTFDILLHFVGLTKTIVSTAAIGIFFSVVRKTIMQSIVSSYLFIFIWNYALPSLMITISGVYLSLYSTIPSKIISGDRFIGLSEWFYFFMWYFGFFLVNVTVFLFLIFWQIKRTESRKYDRAAERRRFIEWDEGRPRATFSFGDWNPVYSREWLELWVNDRKKIIASCIGMAVLSMLIMLGFGHSSVSRMLLEWCRSMPVWAMAILPFLVLPYAVNCIRNEKDRETWELLQTTALRPSKIVLGKFLTGFHLSALRFLSLIALPSVYMMWLALTILNKSTAWGLFFVLFFVTSMWYIVWLVSFGTMISAYAKNTVTANAVAYIFVFAVLYVIPFYAGGGRQSFVPEVFSPMVMWASEHFIQSIRDSSWHGRVVWQAIWIIVSAALFYLAAARKLVMESIRE